MTRSTKNVLGRWLLCASALAACVDKEAQGVGSATDASGGAITSAPMTDGLDTDDAMDTSVMPPDVPTGSGTGDASVGGSDTSTPDPTTDGGETTGGVVSTGCQKVDVLFVIDNGSTMGDEQDALIAAFPGFYDGLKAALGVQDTHVMAVAADDGKALTVTSHCQGEDCFCGPAPTCCQNVCDGGKGDTCNGLTCAGLQISECASQYGSGREYDNQGAYCNLEGGRRYMLDSQPDVHGTFGCIAKVGTYDNVMDKRPMLAAVEATSPAMNGPGGCDEGFLRSDALLVVVVVTDKDDSNEGNNSGSPGSPQEWHDALVNAKGGDPGAVVVLGLVGDGNMTGGSCAANAEPDKNTLAGEPALRLQEFVGMFPNGALGSVCAPDYGAFLTGSISMIDQACDAFTP